MLEKWYENLTYDEAMGGLDDQMKNIKTSFVAAGFYMKYIRDNELYKEAGYITIWEFAEAKYGIRKSTASRWMAINDKFSKDGNSPYLKEQFEVFEKSQLQEMLYLNDKQMEQVTPEMTTREIREIRKEEKKLLKPDENQEEYLKMFARYFISCNYDWFKEKYYERVLDVTKSQDEIKNHLGPNRRTWYFSTRKGTAYIKLFDEYVQIWGEYGGYIGDFEWFYLAKFIQVMWKTVALEKSREKRVTERQKQCVHNSKYPCNFANAKEIALTDGKKCNNACCWSCENHDICGYACNASKEKYSILTESEGFVAISQQEEIPGQMKVYDYPELIPEGMKRSEEIIEAEYKEIQEEQEKPELPILKNNEQRKKFLETYETWPVWFEVPQASEIYYRFDLPDGSSIVVCEYYQYVEWKKRCGQNPETTYHEE